MPGFAAIADSLINLLHGFGNPAAGLGQNGDWYQRLDAAVIGDSMWVKIAGVWVTAALGPPAVTDLQTAYQGGNTIDLTALIGAGVVITNSTAVVTSLMTLTQPAGVALPGMTISHAGSAAAADGLTVTMTGATAAGGGPSAIVATRSGTYTTSNTLSNPFVDVQNTPTLNNGGSTLTLSGTLLTLNHAPVRTAGTITDTTTGLAITMSPAASGASRAIAVVMGANNTGAALDIDHNGGGPIFVFDGAGATWTNNVATNAVLLQITQVAGVAQPAIAAVSSNTAVDTVTISGSLSVQTANSRQSVFQNNAANNLSVVDIYKIPSGVQSGAGLFVEMGGNTTGAGVSLSMDAGSSGNAISITMAAGATGSPIDITSQSRGPLITLSAGANAALTLTHNGTGAALTATSSASSTFTNSATSADYALTVTRSPGGAAVANGLLVSLSANASGDGVTVAHSGGGTGVGITMSSNAASFGSDVSVTGTTGVGIRCQVTNASNGSAVLSLATAGTGSALTASLSNTANVTNGVDITHAGQANAIAVTLSHASSLAGVRITSAGTSTSAYGVFATLTGAAAAGACFYADHLGTGPAISVNDSTGTAGASIEFGDGQTAAVATAATRGRLRFNDATNTFQVSLSGAAYVDLGTATSSTLDAAYDAGGAGLGRTIQADAGSVVIANAAATNNVLLTVTQANVASNAVNVTHAGTGDAVFVNHTGASGALLRLQDSSVDKFSVANDGAATFTQTGGATAVTVSGGTLVGTVATMAVTATMAAVPGGNTNGITFSITSSAGAAGNVYEGGLSVALNAGYTGNQGARGATITCATQSTGTDYIGNGHGNQGVVATVSGTTAGSNVAALLNAFGGNVSVGCSAQSVTAKAGAFNVGVLGLGLNSGGGGALQVGGWFQLASSTPTFNASAALLCDNVATTSDIFVARDNGTVVFTIADTGAVTIVPNGNVVGLVITQGNVASNAHNVTHAGTGIALFINHTGASGDIFNVQDGSAEKFVIEQLGTVDMSGITAGTPNFRFTATSDTPTVVWSALGTFPPDAAPAGYVEITVGGNARYIPFWA